MASLGRQAAGPTGPEFLFDLFHVLTVRFDPDTVMVVETLLKLRFNLLNQLALWVMHLITELASAHKHGSAML